MHHGPRVAPTRPPRRSRPLPIALKRVYDPPSAADGYRVLVERLWPRGVSKRRARVDLWLKDAAPSPALRRWYNHDSTRWTEFTRRYRAELRANPEVLAPLRERLTSDARVTFVYASRETQHNSAVVLKGFLEGSRTIR